MKAYINLSAFTLEAGHLARSERASLLGIQLTEETTPSDTNLRIDVLKDRALLLSNLSTAQAALGKKTIAVASAEKATAAIRQLHAERGDIYRLSELLHTEAEVRRLAGDWNGACNCIQEAADLLAPEVNLNPDVVATPVQLAIIWDSYGLLFIERGQWQKAMDKFQTAIDLLLPLHKEHAEIAQARAQLSQSLTHFADAARKDGQLHKSSEASQLRMELWPSDPNELLQAAREFAQCAAADRDSDFAEQAVTSLRAAVAAGFNDAVSLQNDDAFAAVAKHAAFQRIVAGEDTPRTDKSE